MSLGPSLNIKSEEMNMEEIDQRKQWDKTYVGAKDFFGKEPSELALNALPIFKDNDVRTVLELGCGQGRDTWFFARNGFEVSALDYSEAGICQMKEKARDVGARVTLRVHDAKDPLPFSDASFDAIYSHMFFTMEFSEEEIVKMLAECRRVLRPGGLNIYSVRNTHDPHYGKFVPKGKDMWQNPMGFVVHFFDEDKIKSLSTGYVIMSIKEFEDGSPPFSKKLYEVALRATITHDPLPTVRVEEGQMLQLLQNPSGTRSSSTAKKDLGSISHARTGAIGGSYR